MSELSRPAPAVNEPRQALLIDSNPELNRMLTDLCDQHDWDIRSAKDNQEALELSQSHAFDLIITGGRTSGQQDIELLRRLRLVRPHTRLIILTDEFTPGDVLNSIRERAFSYFARPFSTEELAEIVRSAMTTPFWDDGIEILSATANWVRLADAAIWRPRIGSSSFTEKHPTCRKMKPSGSPRRSAKCC